MEYKKRDFVSEGDATRIGFIGTGNTQFEAWNSVAVKFWNKV